MSLPPAGPAEVSPYDRGFTVHQAYAADPRFSYSLYVPETALVPGSRPELIVAVHGTGRAFEGTRQILAGFARWHNAIVLCPLFPSGVLGDRNLHGYKYLIEGDIRYDRVLLGMVDEIAARYRLDLARFTMTGFSGGGHFVHRFLLVHPNRLNACAIGAPGSVTLLDTARKWWVGIGDFEAQFGVPLDLDAVRRVRIHIAVGAVDLDTGEITHRPGGSQWMEGANDAGATRPERAEALRKSFESQGIEVSFSSMSGAAHDEVRFYTEIQDFLAAGLR